MISLVVASLITMHGTRTCSDGSLPKDNLGRRPLVFEFQRDQRLTITTVTDGTHGGACTTVQRGTYRFDDGLVLHTRVEHVETCGDCPNSPTPEVPESSARFQIVPGGMRFTFESTFGEGGSCRPGEQLILDLRPVKDVEEPRCESPTS